MKILGTIWGESCGQAVIRLRGFPFSLVSVVYLYICVHILCIICMFVNDWKTIHSSLSLSLSLTHSLPSLSFPLSPFILLPPILTHSTTESLMTVGTGTSVPMDALPISTGAAASQPSPDVPRKKSRVSLGHTCSLRVIVLFYIIHCNITIVCIILFMCIAAQIQVDVTGILACIIVCNSAHLVTCR